MANQGLIILDTNILIEVIRRNLTVIQICDKAGTENLAITSVCRSEFLLGSRDKENFEANKKFIDKFRLLRINEVVDEIFTELFEKYSLSHRPAIPDMLIAAAAIHNEASLYTLNTRDFRFIPQLKLLRQTP